MNVSINVPAGAHFHLHVHGSDLGPELLQKVNALGTILTSQGKAMAKTLADLQAADAKEDAKIDALLQAFKDQKDLIKQLQDTIAAGGDPAAIEALVNAADAKSAAIDAVLGVAPPAGDGTGPV